MAPIHPKRYDAFTLVEVVVAMGLMAFGVVVIIGLLSVVLQTNRESRGQMDAANAASSIIAARRAVPTNTLDNVFLPMVNADWNSTTGKGYVTSDGSPTTSLSAAAYYVTYQVGTNSATGDRAANIHLELSWPPASTNTQNHSYEMFTTVAW